MKPHHAAIKECDTDHIGDHYYQAFIQDDALAAALAHQWVSEVHDFYNMRRNEQRRAMDYKPQYLTNL